MLIDADRASVNASKYPFRLGLIAQADNEVAPLQFPLALGCRAEQCHTAADVISIFGLRVVVDIRRHPTVETQHR